MPRHITDEKILLQEGLDGIKDESKRQQYKDVEIETIKVL